MQYTRMVHLIGGEKILITDKECEDLVNLINSKPQGFVKIQNSLINKNSIAYIGQHQATAQMYQMDKAQAETEMKVLGKGDLVEKKKLEEKKVAIENALKEKRSLVGKEYEDYLKTIEPKQIENKPQTSEQVIDGEPAYYLDELGEKHYT